MATDADTDADADADEDIALANAMSTDDDMSMIPNPPSKLSPIPPSRLSKIYAEDGMPTSDPYLKQVYRPDAAMYAGSGIVPERAVEDLTLGEVLELQNDLENPYPRAQRLQDTGMYVGLTPPLGPLAAMIQTAGDVMYTAGAGYQAYKGVPGKAAETAGGVASIINPFPTPKLSLAKGVDRAVRSIPVTRNQARAAADYGYSQGVQEVGEAVGKRQFESSDDGTLLKKLSEWGSTGPLTSKQLEFFGGE